MGADIAGEPCRHGEAFDVITQVTTSPFCSDEDWKTLPVPASFPFTFHWNAGDVPPFTGVAVKLTCVPEQIDVSLAEMLTDALRTGLTVTTT